MEPSNLRTVKQLASELPAFTESSLRWLVFHAQENRLESAIVRPPGTRRVLIDRELFAQWLVSRGS